ncbi:ribonuclease HII [Paenibacillus senegalensis]|uniref:ribonuclease HII n=1 Tax=Paenibacillus senegalensis TaxID=1465766 RepID=UPI00028A3BF3|nr:ribonuclease HII [Paenibacillus senegalensis]
MLTYEKSLWDRGYRLIAGVDEVGRGCLFGDVVAAAVILPQGLLIEDINDSKKLSAKKREELYEVICKEAVAVSTGQVSSEMIDQINIKQAARLAMKQAVEGLSIMPDYLLIDAERIDVNMEQMAVIHGDALSQSIAAASIIAKVTRDRMCLHWDREYPEYGIAIHKGYATKQHRESILQYGPSRLHRRSFLSKLLNQQQQFPF